MNSNPLEEQLRKERQEIWSRYALAARTNSALPKSICREWSQAADELLKKAFEDCFQGQDIALFAFGKLGSRELNLSSDVDLLLVSQESTVESLSSLRKFQKLLHERSSLGFVFRVDFDLRPGGRQGALIPTVEQFKDYYGNYGETWERLAFVRLRGLCGNEAIIQEVLQFSKHFSFRRHLDFTLFEDLKHLRSKIQDHYWDRADHDKIIDLKLGVGGIRDVELFTHALQVVHGGKDRELQISGTDEALMVLERKKLLPEGEADFLIRHYWNLRCLENYVQALHDEQTHLIRLEDEHPDFINELIRHLKVDMQKCDQIVMTLLGEAPEIDSSEEDLEQSELWQEIMAQEVLSPNKARDEIARRAVLYQFLHSLKAQQGDTRKGLLLLKDFIHSIRAKASFFSLLLREKVLLQKLAWLFGHSPYLSRILINRPELLDSFVYRVQNAYSADIGQLLEELAEKKLLSQVINGSDYLENKSLPRLLYNLTATADEIAEKILIALKKDFPSTIKILALGKWGGAELGFRSDLDFIFVVKDEPSENDFKIAKRFISRMTEPHRGGNIYSIDMRLRPSGKGGPMLITLSDLMDYLAQDALPWERQAYLKARWIGEEGPSLAEVCVKPGLSEKELRDLENIRLKLQQPSKPHLNLKFSEGGLVDIELAIQAYLLAEKIIPNGTNIEAFFSSLPTQAAYLRQNYARLRQIEQMLQLVASEALFEVRENSESFQALAVALQTSTESLLLEIINIFKGNLTSLKELDPRRGPH